MYTIIHKIDYVNGAIRYTPDGYTTSKTDCDRINQEYDETFGKWMSDNEKALTAGNTNISEFFETTPAVYVARTTTTDVKGLTEIRWR